MLTGRLLLSKKVFNLGDYKPRESMMLENLPGINWTLGTKFNQWMSYCKTAEVLDTWAEFKQLKRHSSHCLSVLSPCPGPSAILKNSLSAWLVTWSNSNSSNGTLPTVCLCCLLSCFLPRALCNIEEFSLSLTGHLAEIKQFKTALFLPANCSGCLQYWRNLANNTKNLGILVSFWNFSISRPIN